MAIWLCGGRPLLTCASHATPTVLGVDPAAPDVDQLAAFARWLERTPSRKHRPGRQRRRAARPNLAVLGRARSAVTVEGILAAVVEFVRFGASRGWCAHGCR